MATNLKQNRRTLSCILVVFLSAFSLFLVRNVSAEDNISDAFDTQLRNEHVLNQQNYLIKLASKVGQTEALENSDVGIWLKDSLREIYYKGYGNIFTELVNQRKTPSEEAGLFQSSEHVQDESQSESDFTRHLRDSEMSSACVNDTLRILSSIGSDEKWAIPFVDSTGKPGPSITLLRLKFVGNYKQCRASVAPPDQKGDSDGFVGNYCDVGFVIKPLGGLVKIEFGACVPDTCSLSDLYELEMAVINMVNQTTLLSPMTPECHTDEREVTTATIAAITILSIIAFLMVISTTYDLLFIQEWSFLKSNTAEDFTASLNHRVEHNTGNGHHLTIPEHEPSTMKVSSEATPLLYSSKDNVNSKANNANKDQDTLAKVILAFSVYSNAKKVLNTSQPSGSLGAIHGIRFLSMSWVVLGHTLLTTNGVADNAAEDYPSLLKRWTFDAISNALPSVDTFFTLSGLLTSYLTIKEMNKKSWKINWPLFYFHRFWRLTPPYMLALLIVLGFQRFLGSGALWATMQPADKTNCEDNWWTNLLYINNVVNVNQMCFGHSWYLANDMQFFVLSPLMLIPFYFHRLAGLASCSVFLVVSWIITGSLSSDHNWPTTMISAREGGLVLGDWFQKYYVVPWCRIGPFVVGILAGYVLAITDGGKHLRMKWWMAVSGWVVAIVSGICVVYGLDGDISGDNVSSLAAAALYNAVSRSVWGACVSWVIIACASGNGGPVNTLLSWSPFVVLGRLTYMSYLIHLSMLAIYFQNADKLFHYTDTTMAVTYVGLLVIVNMTAFVFMLALESPMIGLEKALLGKKKRRD